MRLRYQRMSGEARRLLAEEGESGRFEFKQTPDAVKIDVLVAAANAVTLERITQGFVTILVGVGEREDPETGVVTGEVLGISTHADGEHRRRGIEKARSAIQSRAASTRPVPINLTIVEENVATRRPFLRLQVSPSFVPHHSPDGRRVTRYGASTRAIEDEELLDLYLLREARLFENRFRAVSAHLESRLYDVSRTVDSVGDDMQESLSRIREIANEAVSEAEDGKNFAEEALDAVGAMLTTAEFEDAVRALFEAVTMTAEGTWHALRQQRAGIWFVFSWVAGLKADSVTWQRTGKRVRRFLDSEVALDDFVANRAELDEWKRLLAQSRPREWSAQRWRDAIAAAERARAAGGKRITDAEPLVYW